MRSSAPPPRRPLGLATVAAFVVVGGLVRSGGAAPVVTTVAAAPTASPTASPDGRPRAGERSDAKAEYRVKAAFLFHFAKYVTWPKTAFAKPDSPLVIGIVGEDPFGEIIDKALKDKKVGGRAVSVVRLEPKDAADAHVLFVGALEEEELEMVEKACAGEPVLLVGERADFARDVGTMNFYIEKKKVRFECNAKRAKELDLTISSQLLKLARIVEPVKKGER